jgi:hypothetical protein
MLEARVVNLKYNSNVIIYEGFKKRSQMHLILNFRIHGDGKI